MLNKIMIILALVFSLNGMSSTHQIIDTLGSSPKGQFVALEEYGYKSEKHSYYVKIKIMNVWKKEYVGSTIVVEAPAHRPQFLVKARKAAREQAKDELKKFNISG